MDLKKDEDLRFVGLVQQRGRYNKLNYNRRVLVLDLKRQTLVLYDQNCLKSNSDQGKSLNENVSLSSAAIDQLFEGKLRKGSPMFFQANSIQELKNPKLHLTSECQWEFQDVKDYDDLQFRVIINNIDKNLTVMESAMEYPQDSSGLLINNSLSELEQINENYGSIYNSSQSQSTEKNETSSTKIIIKCKSRQIKGLWLQAATHIGRCQEKDKRTKKFFSLLSRGMKLASKERKIHDTNTLLKRNMSIMFKSKENFSIEQFFEEFHKGELATLPKSDGKHIKVLPDHVYKYDLMTQDELLAEMLLPSVSFVDLRPPTSADEKPIGFIRVEVLNCTNLPKLDTLSKTDAVCYLVCGSHAFCTDVIDDTLNPIWPRKSKRACIFPIFHVFAQLFVGVFDDDGEYDDDDFAGRVVIDLSRLRPKTMYDITIPLRDNSFAYSQKSLGAIRLRFTLEFENEQAAIMSYIPNLDEMKAILKCQSKTTVKCADKKAFRNVAITVHGKYLPGRFSLNIQKAIMREFKMIRLLGLYTAKKTAVQTVTWEYPFISFFVFIGWMTCVYKKSMTMVPPYIFGVILLFMIRNYGGVVDSMNHWGFNPLYFEELFMALVFGTCFDTNSMKPLDTKPGDDISIKGRKDDGKQIPWFTWFFSLIGVLPKDHFGNSRLNYDHMEFPFSFGDEYPKKLLKDLTSSEYCPEEDTFDDESSNAVESDQQNEFKSTISEFEPLIGREIESGKSNESIRKRIPNQDASVFMKAAIPIEYDLLIVKDKIQKKLLHCFDDRVCNFEDVNEYRKKQVEYMLESELGIHDYPTIITRKMADHISPVLGIMKIFLGFFRAVFNIFLWKDPYLSFWVCILLLGLIAILLIFPWRFFFGIMGILVFGPQNYFMKTKIQEKVLFLKPKPEFKPWKKRFKSKEKPSILRTSSNEESLNLEPIFRNHLVSDSDYSSNASSSSEIREVVIPYSRLRHNRFYDWPPDPNMSKAAEFPDDIRQKVMQF